MEKTQLQNYHVHYGPAQGWSRVDLRELWRYKDLIWLFVKRDFNVMYKQTVLGPAWILINPLMSTAMYCVMFGTIAQLSTDGVPQILFYLAGTALWGFFSSCINKVSGTFTTNSNIFSKVYFPRLAMPISTVISGLINFLVQFALFFILLLVYLAKGEVSPHWGMLLLCVPLVLQVGLLGLGCGIIVSSLTTRYRDLMVVVTFGVQLWMYGSPVVYPLSMITHPVLRAVMVINPMTAPMESFRYIFFGTGQVTGVMWASSLIWTVALLALALCLDPLQPINKKLWTPAFVFAAGAYSLGMFALFYYIIDVCQWRRWSYFFKVIGVNSITIYMVQRIVRVSYTSEFFFGGLASKLSPEAAAVVLSAGYVAVCWLLLWFLDRKKIYLKI